MAVAQALVYKAYVMPEELLPEEGKSSEWMDGYMAGLRAGNPVKVDNPVKPEGHHIRGDQDWRVRRGHQP